MHSVESLLLSRRRGLRLLWCFGLFAHGHSQRALHIILYLLKDYWLILQSLLRVLATLAESLALVREPRTTLFNYAIVRREIEQVAFLRNAFAVHDVELGLAERRRDFVFRDFHFRAIADHAIGVLDRADATDVEAQAGIEFQRASAGGSFRIPKHHANLFANLIDED